MNLTPVRRVVTGHDTNGRAVISLDGAPPNVIAFKAVPGTVFHEVWNTNATPAAIDNNADPTLRPLQLAPTPHGSVIRVVDIPPDSVQNKVSSEDVAACFASIGAGHALPPAADARHKIMHRTETVDYAILISGELWLVVDEGEVRLSPGDIVVQRGTNHAWSNRTEQIARIAFVLLDGKFAPELKGSAL